MNELLDLILAPLEPQLADQVRQRFEVERTDPDLDDLWALNEVLQDCQDEGSPDWWLALHVDWKAYGNVQWQVQAIARTLGLDVNFESRQALLWDEYFDLLDLAKASMPRPLPARKSLLSKLRQELENIGRSKSGSTPEPLPLTPEPPSDTPTMDVLGEASGWLRERGYELLYLDTGGDEYLAVPVRLDLLAQAQAAAERLKISTYLV